jgi:histidine triad (HIT) family protein
MKDNTCVFCKIVQKEIKADFAEETNNFIAIRDAHPKAEGHTLIIPKKHFVTLLDINNVLGQEMLELMKKVASNLMDRKLGDGFNVVMNNLEPAGQVVKHAHIHIIPRKEGDGLKSLA